MKGKTQDKLSIFLISLYILTSCSLNTNDRHNVQIFDDFPITVNLSHEKIVTDSILYSVGGLLLLDSVLISIDFKADTFFQVFKLPSFQHIGGFITKGPGPKEEINIDPFIGQVSNSEFLYKSLSSIKYVKYNNHTNSLEITTQINLPTDLIEVWNPIKLGDTIISNKAFSLTDREYIGYNIKNKTQFDFGSNYPSVGEKIDIKLKAMVFAKANIVKPDGSAFACVYDKFPILRIYTNSGKLKKEIRFKNGQSFPYALIEHNPSIYSFKDVMQNYRFIKSSDKYIYASYVGKSANELLSEGISYFSNEIHVWNWDGEPIKRIILDENIFAFEVDSLDNYLIASSLLSIDTFYKYNLK